MKEAWVLRLSHRKKRDIRITTHVALVARAFGASGMYYSGDYDASLEQSIKKVTMMWGGNFQLLYVKDPVKLVKSWLDKGSVIHLSLIHI